ncbi:MAG: hypothetical protein Q9184_008548, partial [Pyrenodesmia sp. 2 TL-2023]
MSSSPSSFNTSKQDRRVSSAIGSAVATVMLWEVLKRWDGLPSGGKEQKTRDGEVETEPLMAENGEVKRGEREEREEREKREKMAD